jgi:DNA repair protein RadC
MVEQFNRKEPWILWLGAALALHALLHSAYGFVVVHNHPSGDPNPSDADRRFTRRLKDGADLLSLHLVDHVIIGHPSPDRPQPFFSFRAAGML